VAEKPEDKGGTVVKPGEKGKPGDKNSKPKRKGAMSRLDVAKRELTTVLTQLPEGRKVNVLRFDSMITDFAALVYPDKKGRRFLPRLDGNVRTAAKAFVDQSTAQGLTNLFGVLKEALEYEEVDTIYLLSDGAPTIGVTDHSELLKQLQRLNRRRKVKINAISFHPDPAERELLRSIALRNHGVYVER